MLSSVESPIQGQNHNTPLLELTLLRYGAVWARSTIKTIKMVSEEKIKELQRILLEEFGEKTSFEEASDIAYGLVGYFDKLGEIQYRISNPAFITLEFNVTIHVTIKYGASTTKMPPPGLR